MSKEGKTAADDDNLIVLVTFAIVFVMYLVFA